MNQIILNKEYTDLTEELDGENGLIIQLEENEELKNILT